MKQNLIIFGLIASTFLSCSENKADRKNGKSEVILEQKKSSEAHEQQNAIKNLQSLNEDQIEYLKSKNGTDQVISEEKTSDEETLKENLDELNRINNEKENLKKE